VSDLVGIILIIVFLVMTFFFAVLISGTSSEDKQRIKNQDKIIKELEEKLKREN